MARFTRWICGFLCLGAPNAWAQTDAERAEDLFTQGVSLMKEGNFGDACSLIRDSYQLDPRTGTLFTLADCFANSGKIYSAILHYNEFLALSSQAAPGPQAKQKERIRAAEEQRKRLTPLVPTLTLVLASEAPAGTELWLDEVPVPPHALGLARMIDPGDHTITLKIPDGYVRRDQVAFSAGQRSRLILAARRPDLALVPHRIVEGPPPAPLPSSHSLQTAAYLTAGAGAFGLVMGTTAGFVALHNHTRAKNRCVDSACTPEGKTAADRSRVLGDLSTVGLVIGGVALGTATALWLLDPSHRSVGEQRTHHESLRPRWYAHGSPTGAFGGLEGTW